MRRPWEPVSLCGKLDSLTALHIRWASLLIAENRGHEVMSKMVIQMNGCSRVLANSPAQRIYREILAAGHSRRGYPAVFVCFRYRLRAKKQKRPAVNHHASVTALWPDGCHIAEFRSVDFLHDAVRVKHAVLATKAPVIIMPAWRALLFFVLIKLSKRHPHGLIR